LILFKRDQLILQPGAKSKGTRLGTFRKYAFRYPAYTLVLVGILLLTACTSIPKIVAITPQRIEERDESSKGWNSHKNSTITKYTLSNLEKAIASFESSFVGPDFKFQDPSIKKAIIEFVEKNQCESRINAHYTLNDYGNYSRAALNYLESRINTYYTTNDDRNYARAALNYLNTILDMISKGEINETSSSLENVRKAFDFLKTELIKNQILSLIQMHQFNGEKSTYSGSSEDHSFMEDNKYEVMALLSENSEFFPINGIPQDNAFVMRLCYAYLNLYKLSGYGILDSHFLNETQSLIEKMREELSSYSVVSYFTGKLADVATQLKDCTFYFGYDKEAHDSYKRLIKKNPDIIRTAPKVLKDSYEHANFNPTVARVLAFYVSLKIREREGIIQDHKFLADIKEYTSYLLEGGIDSLKLSKEQDDKKFQSERLIKSEPWILEFSGDFEKLVKKSQRKPVVVYFTASWCGPCKEILPKLVVMAKEQNDGRFYDLAIVDIDHVMGHKKWKQSEYVPELIVLRNGNVFYSTKHTGIESILDNRNNLNRLSQGKLLLR